MEFVTRTKLENIEILLHRAGFSTQWVWTNGLVVHINTNSLAVAKETLRQHGLPVDTWEVQGTALGRWYAVQPLLEGLTQEDVNE